MLAIDLGSTVCKAGYLDRRGTIVAQGRAPCPRPAVAGGQPALADFWPVLHAAVRAAGDELRCAGQEPRPAALGLSCRAMFGIFLDQDGQPLPGSGQMLAVRGAPDTIATCASPAWGPDGPYAYAYASRQVATARWYRRTHPDCWQRVRRIGALRDWLVLQLTGQWVTDLATGPGQDDWPRAVPTLTTAPLDAFPPVRDGHTVAGALIAPAASALGLPAGTTIVTGYHDGSAAGIGTGTIAPGDTCLTIGTNLAFRPVCEPRPPDCFGYPIIRDSWAWVDSVPSSATRLDDVASLLVAGNGSATVEDHARLATRAARVPAGANGLRMPVFAREDPARHLRAATEAKAAGRSAGAIYRAMMEALAIDLWQLSARARHDGARPRRYVATGGAVANPLFVRIISGMLNVPIAPGPAEAGLLGAGIGAAVGAGWYCAIPEAVADLVHPGTTIDPIPSDVTRYAALRAEWDECAPKERRA